MEHGMVCIFRITQIMLKNRKVAEDACFIRDHFQFKNRFEYLLHFVRAPHLFAIEMMVRSSVMKYETFIRMLLFDVF